MSKSKDNNSLLFELETLQQVLDDNSSDVSASAPTLEEILDLEDSPSFDDIPTLSEAIDRGVSDTKEPEAVKAKPQFLSVVTEDSEQAIPEKAEPKPEPTKFSQVDIPKVHAETNNPYLTTETLDRLAYERKAAADTAINALNVMAKVADQKKAQQHSGKSPDKMSRLEKQHIVDELVEEMLPAIEARLRAKLIRMIK